MATDDLKKKFAERIQERQAQMSQNSTQKTEGSKSSTTSTKPATSTKPSSTTGSTSDDLKNKFADRINERRIQLGMDQPKDDSFLSQFMSDSNGGATRRYTAARVASPVSSYKNGLGRKGWRSYTAANELKRAAAEAEDEEKSWFERIIGYLGTSPDSTLPMANATIAGEAYRKDTSYREPSADWNDYERDIFGYLYANDREASWRYAEEVNNAIANEKKQGQVKQIQKDAISNPVRATAGALLTSPLGLADYMDALVESNARGTITEKDTVTPFEYSQAVTGGISQNLNDKHGTLNEDIPIIGGKGWGDVYGLGVSIAQSSLASIAGGGFAQRTADAIAAAGGQALVTFFGSAAASGVEEAKQRGASDEQAIFYGTLAGVAEALAEKSGVDNLMKIGSAATMRQLLANLVKQGAAEGMEEGITTILNNFADQLVMQDKSNFNILVQQYMKQGLSESDAKKQAWLDMANDLAFDMVSGFVSGAVHAAPKTAKQTYLTGREMRNNYGDSQRELVDDALEINPENAYAKKMQERLDYGKDLRGGQLYNLVNQNDAAIAADIQAQAEQRLTELGETGNVKAVAAALTKQAMGQDLTNAEKNRVSKSRFGQQVAEELNAGEAQQMDDTATAEDTMEPNAIHAEEYGRMLEAAETAHEGAEVSDEQVTTQAPKAVEAAQMDVVEPETATVAENATVPANGQQVSKPEAVAEESSDAPKAVTLEEVSQKYGAQAQAMIHTYQNGQDVAKYDQAYQAAYNMGKSGVSLSYAQNSESTSYLTDTQRELAYKAGQAASNTAASEQETKNKAAVNGKTGHRKGTVKGEGVTISDLKKTFNDAQGRAYKYLSTVAEVTGIDIVLYKSEAGETGAYEGSQGKFRWSNNTVYIDVNAGLAYAKDAGEVSKYAMLRTFSHEFTHFIEKWNPVRYNEFRKVVFDTLTERGEDVHDLIEQKQAQDATGKMTYDDASREVVAESMTDILTDANFVQELAEKHKTIFDKLLEKMKEFVSNLREAFAAMGDNPSREANALKEQVGDTVKYLDSIVELFNRVAVEAVENYQQTVAEEVVEENATTDTTTVSETEKVETTVETKAEEVETKAAEEKPTEPKKKPVKKEKRPALPKTKKADWASHDVEWTIPGRKTPIAYSTQAVSYAIEVMADEYPTATIRELQEKFHYGPDEKKVLQRYIDAGYGNQVANEWFSYEKKGGKKPVPAETIKNEEVTDNGTEETGAVLPHRSDGTRAARLLDDAEAGAVPGDESAGNPVDDPGERGHETGRHDHRPDAERHERGHGEGSGESRDLRRDDGVTAEEPATDTNVGDNGSMRTHAEAKKYAADRGYRIEINKMAARKRLVQVDIYDKNGLPTFNPIIINEASDWGKVKEAVDRREESEKAKAEQLHEEAVEQIAQQSTEQPKGRNFVIGDSLDLPNGEKSRYKANVEAIRLVKKLEAEGRYATEAEQVILSKYVGWGGLANAFDQRKADWSKEYAELKELLTEEEYSSARGSTLNAHYTEVSVIKAMYDGLKHLGFTGGRMMEPSSGVGNFVGAMPADMSEKVRSWTMVELDGITGLIAKYLYPNADVRIQGFEKANIPDNFMDVAIGNVPFGNYAIADKHYPKKVTSAIHNYFFAKSLDKVRPGGIVMFITSSYTMNSSDSTVRRYIMQRADLLGAIRLPDTTFKGNAGTEVVTDILILKKRAANTNYTGESFLEAPYTRPIEGNWNGAYINEYFNNHPEMVLGTASFESGMYRGSNLTYKALEGKGSLADQIRAAFQNIQAKMDYPAKLTPEKTNFAVERAGKNAKNNSLTVKDGKVYQNKNGELVEVKTAKGAAERIAGMLEIRDAAKALQTAQQQGLNESEIRKARTALNKAYDTFVKKHGFLNAQANRNAIKDDPDKFSIFALENYNPETKQATKADIFSKNTIAPNRTVTSAKDVAEGLIVSVNQTGGVDAALIAKLTGKTEEAVTQELLDSRKVFKNRNGGLETAEVYLSGNVRAKLRDAEAMALMDKDYQRNVEALKAVVPEDVGYQDIFVNPGTPWIPDSVYSDFGAHILGGYNTEWRKDVTVTRNADTGNFTVELGGKHLKYNAANTQKWGTGRRSFLDLFDAMLNSKSVVVKNKTDDGKSVVDQDATAAANEKVEAIQKEFQEWLWQDEGRRTELATLYNETFNSIVTPKYNGDNLTVNGANAMKPLRPHQRDAVQRIISSGGNTLLAHKVGAGKTYEMAAAAMKLKELGLVKKPLFAVPKSLVAQWGNEFMDFFPTAKLLVAEQGDFTAANRKVFANRIANGEYDAVIVSYEQFEKLPISADFARDLYQEQIDSIIRAIEEAKAEKGGKSLSIKDLEKKRKQLQTKIDKLTDSAKDEDNIEFEQLGVDSIFVDEAHNFKNLFYTTSMTNVSGLGNKDGSKRAFDLYTKVRYLQKLNGGRGIVFATATPVMNSMSEMYIMQKYLQPDLLDQLGLSTFDAWAKQFGEVVNGVEIKPSGQGYRVKQSFSRFKNMSELQLLFRNFADVLTDIPGLKIPKMKGGKVNVVVCDPGQFQQDYMKELEQRADNIKNVDPSVDNMLKITSDGRKISYTQRMIDPSLPYEEGCKIFRCADNVLRVYGESKAIKGTQIIFCDMATPKGKSKATAETEELETDMESAKLYDDIKARLMKGGIPAKEIAFIHEADTDAKKKKLFADVNEGKVRVLIGSTGKMGVGMNAQKRIVAIHHLDAPWRPGDVEQRNGRAYRQGNINDEVENFTYVTEGSFDARLWDILERKKNFINQVMNGENVGRETEDTGEVTLSAAEVKALASGSPLIMEQVQLDTDIKKLESLQRAHRAAVANAWRRLETDKGTIATMEKYAENGKKDLKARVDTYSEDKFSITIGKKKYTDKKDAGVALMAEATAKATEEGYTTIGTFAGFDLRVIKTSEGIKGLISGSQGYAFHTYPNNTTYMVNHLISKVEGIEEAVKQWEKKMTETRADMAEQEQLINQPFAKQEELDKKRARYNEVMAILNPKEEQQLSSMDEDTVQEQSREYLDEQHQKRTNTLTDREVLAMAADAIKVDDLTDAEKDALDIFKKRLSKLESLQNERAEQGRIYKEQQFGAKVDREAAKETLNRMKVLDDQIKSASAEVLSVEEKTVLKRVLQKARKVVAKEQWNHDQKTLERWRDRRNKADAIKKYRERLSKDVKAMTDWVLHPNNKDVVKHIPDVLKNSVIPFLSSIDFTSKQQLHGGAATKADQEFMKRLNGLKAALKPDASVDGLYADYTDLPPNFMDRLQTLIDSAQQIVNQKTGDFVVNQMTSDELRELSQVVRTLKQYIQNFNRFHVNAMFQHVYEAGDSTIGELEQMGNASERTGKVSNFVFWQQIRPAYAFERFGKGGEAIYDGLRQGQAKLAFNTKTIEAFAKKAYTEHEVKTWEKQVKTINLGGDIVKMPVSTIMSFYELSKRPQALGHILGGGIRVATFKQGGKKISDTGHTITVSDVQTIIGTLTDRQKEVADKLQNFMQEQGGSWGNHVSVKRFGEELFGEDHYFPINSDGRHLPANADEHPSAASLYALLNMGFTKATQEGANNRVVLYSIFDVFANHMASMAQYNAFALPVVDAIKWFNYQQKSEADEDGKRIVLSSVRDQMDRVYGVPEESRPGSGRQGYAQTFVINILRAFNGTEAQGVPTDSTGIDMLHRYNVAQVAYNFRVVVQQPLAITRAALLIDYGSIIKGMKLNPAVIRKNIEEMNRYSGIAAWKSLGFYDVNISRGLTDLIKHDTGAIDKINDFGMKGAEIADTLTWAGIWSACKEEVIRKQHLTPKSKGFYEAVTKLFEDVIYKTQVVDSVLTKNEYLRSKGFFARTIGSFMSEPTTTASMLINAYDKYHADMQRGMNRTQAWKKNGRMIGRTMYVYGLSAVILAAVQAVADAWRDDDEYQEWLEKWLEAFSGNLLDELMPLNKLPIFSEFYEFIKELISVGGFDIYGQISNLTYAEIGEKFVKGLEIIYGRITGEEDRYTWYGGIYKLMQAVSGITGLPMASATREIIGIWNHTAGAMAPSLKVKTYDSGEKNEIKYAYEDGYLTAEEAMAELMDKALVDTEDEAYWMVQGWEAGEGYSRYNAIYDAVRSGSGFAQAMKELTAHGHEEEDVLSQVKDKIGEWYRDGEITKQQAITMLTKYSGMDSEDITPTVNKWSSKVVTGIAFDDIKEEFLDGNITERRAVDMYVRYGGYDQDKASEMVTKWRAEKETGIVYDDIKEAFMDGEITEGDVRNMYVTYGGYSAEDAAEKAAIMAFVKQHPGCDGISWAAVENYTEYCESSGMKAETFWDVWKFNSTTKADVDGNGESISGSKKVKVLNYINGLDLTYAQKDSLYYAFGWAESRIYEAPWH